MKKLIILVILVALFAPISPVAAQIATSTSPTAVTTEQALISALNQLIKILLVQLDSLQKQLAVEIAKVQDTQVIQQTQINTIVENTTVNVPAPTPVPDLTDLKIENTRCNDQIDSLGKYGYGECYGNVTYLDNNGRPFQINIGIDTPDNTQDHAITGVAQNGTVAPASFKYYPRSAGTHTVTISAGAVSKTVNFTAKDTPSFVVSDYLKPYGSSIVLRGENHARFRVTNIHPEKTYIITKINFRAIASEGKLQFSNVLVKALPYHLKPFQNYEFEIKYTSSETQTVVNENVTLVVDSIETTEGIITLGTNNSATSL